jgi:hypothetical protein
MLEYREKISNTEDDIEPPEGSHSGEVPKYMTLAEQYGLSDDMNIGESKANEQTIEQEFQAYITAPLTPTSVNILKFWEVCILAGWCITH